MRKRLFYRKTKKIAKSSNNKNKESYDRLDINNKEKEDIHRHRWA